MNEVDLDLLYHLALDGDWRAAQETGEYRSSTLGRTIAEEGFIHCSFAHQVRATADGVFGNRPGVLLLAIDPRRLPAPPVVEAADGSSESFPHLYEPLPLSAVVSVTPVEPGEDGRLTLGPLEPPREPALVVGRLDRRDIGETAALHDRAGMAAYSHIFPVDAPAPAREDLARRWHRWLVEDAPARVGHAVRSADGHLVGVALSGPDLDDPESGHLARLYVEPFWWRLGVARTLYAASIEHLRAERYPRATLWALEGNDRARRWYERMGWELTGRTKVVHEPSGTRDVQYALTL